MIYQAKCQAIQSVVCYLSCLSGLCGLLWLAPSVHAQVYCNITLGNPGEGPPQGNLFSGTDNNFTVSAPTQFFDLASLVVTINGIVVDILQPPPDAPIPPYAPVSILVTFDSTHFPDGTQITLTAIATDAGGNQATATQWGTVVNKALLYGRNDFETSPGGNGCTAATNPLAAMNHTITTNTTLGWSATMFLNALGGTVTALYVNTHGNNNPQITSDLDELNGIWEYITPSTPPLDVQEYCERHQIPINIAFLDACQTGQKQDFALALLLPYRGISNPPLFGNDAIDQAEVGWAVNCFVPYTNADSSQFWNALANGRPVYAARDAAVNAQYQAYLPLYQQGAPWPDTWPNPLGGALPPPLNLLPPALNDNQCQLFACVWGDYYATLHGVYTGNSNTSANIWYLIP
jgi:hypothetical protein